MRKNILLSFLLMFGVAISGANAANARGNARGVNNATASNAAVSAAPVAARAGARQKVVSTPTAASNAAAAPAAPVAARAGARQKVVSAPKPGAGQPMAARAGATQKVVQTGQKVNVASSNSVVPQECQDAFYGCMDSFCMLDNISGGRCQCNDKIVSLDAEQEEILKMDKQTYAMATEGVERIQMGEAEDELMSQVKKVTDGLPKKTTAENIQISKAQVDDDDDDLIGGVTKSESFANKKGTALYKASATMCVKTIPEQCRQYSSMLQLVYSQKIKSDCIAYENSLKQQKNESKQKLQAANKALRDAASEEFNSQNKYATSGECAIAFAKCMQDEAGCGSDYTGCVTLAAKDNVSGIKAKQTTIKGRLADITLAATTMDALLAKKEICQKVVKQCVVANEKQDVWTMFLRNAAPELKSAEEMAESNLRMQCIPTVAECFKTACKSQIDPNDKDGSYDMCLSNPKTYKSLCKVQLEPCLNATGGTFDNPEKSSLWNGLLAALKSMKVDACTKQIKTCITERCGEDYSGCVGLDTESIGNLCPVDKLTACMTNYNRETVRDYVAEIAQGLAVQVDNSLLTVCQKAVNDSMMKVCGDTETCDALMKDEKLGTRSLEYNICSFKGDEAGQQVINGSCKSSLDQISDSEWNEWVWAGSITGMMYWGLIDYDFDKNMFTTADEYLAAVETQFGKSLTEDEKTRTNKVYNEEIGGVQSAINNAIKTIEADPTVQYCMTGREVQGFDASKKIGKKTKKVRNPETGKMEIEDASASRFPNLTDQVKRTIIAYALRGARDKYDEKYNAVYEQLMKDQVAAAEKTDHQKAVETAKNTCDTWAANSVLPRSKTPVNVWNWIGMAILAAACVVAAVFTGGAPLALLATAIANTAAMATVSATAIVVGTIATAAVTSGVAGAAAVATAVHAAKKGEANDTIAEPARAQLDQWNYRATITTLFDPATGECTKETIYRNCDKASYSTGKCKRWGEEKTEVKKLKLL